MSLAIMLVLALILLLLNSFFVLAEFATVKMRSTQIDLLAARRHPAARILRHVNQRIEEYLSVCQLGITLASIGLGAVGEPALARVIKPLVGSSTMAHTAAIGISYLLVSILHIILGEQVPKVAAVRDPEHASILTAAPIRFFYSLFYLPLKALNGAANAVLYLLRLPHTSGETAPSEAELRLILDSSQRQGMMPFRRLLLMENVFDFGSLRVSDEMRAFEQVTALYTDRPWEENRNKILSTTFSRYPLLAGTPPQAVGIVHLKDLLYRGTPWPEPVDLRAIARKCYLTTRDTLLEQLLTDLRRRRQHLALVQDEKGVLCGLITMEDILEQLVGAIEDEFEKEAPLRLGDVLTEGRILIDLDTAAAMDAIPEILTKAATDEIPVPKQAMIEAVLARERSLCTYLGEGLAVPHARIEGLKAPFVFFARSRRGVIFEYKAEQKAHMLFLLLTPLGTPRAQTRLLSRIAALRERSYVWDRLDTASSRAEILEAIRSGDELTTAG
jgi:CBS domain containing-hemolysin-like protein/mannitol/fructose-specific phosphotransferase system IIA component (Ntr-type)